MWLRLVKARAAVFVEYAACPISLRLAPSQQREPCVEGQVVESDGVSREPDCGHLKMIPRLRDDPTVLAKRHVAIPVAA